MLRGDSGIRLFWVLKRDPRRPVVGGVGMKLFLLPFGLVLCLLEVVGGVGMKSPPFTSSGFFLSLNRFLFPLFLVLCFFASGTAVTAPLVLPAGKFAKLGDPLEFPGIFGIGSALVDSI